MVWQTAVSSPPHHRCRKIIEQAREYRCLYHVTYILIPEMSDSPPPEQVQQPSPHRILRGVWRVAKWVFFSIGCLVTLFVCTCTAGIIYSELDKSADWVYDKLAPEKDVEIIDSVFDYYDYVHGDYAASYIIRLRTPEAAERFVQEIYKRDSQPEQYAMEDDGSDAFSTEREMYNRCRREFGADGAHYRIFLYGDCPHWHRDLHHPHTRLHIYAAGNGVFFVHVNSI